MPNESEVEVVPTENDYTVEEGESTQEGTQENTPESEPKESPEDKLARLERQARQLRKKLGQDVEPKPKKTKSDDLDYGAKAYLVANGIKGEEIGLVQDIMRETGRSLDDVLESRHFKGMLQEMRDSRATADAIPKGTKRSSTSSVNEVEYWIAKGELPADTPANRELRTKIVQEEIRREKNKSIFGGSSKIIIK